jgi:phosphate-selective porin OprO/OprP
VAPPSKENPASEFGAESATSVRCPPDDDSLPCKIRRADARWRYELGGHGPLGIDWQGLLMLDFAGPNSVLIDDNNVQVRRLRIGFDRRFEEWTLRGYAEYKTGRLELEELYLKHALWAGQFVIGNQTEPFGLERITGVASTTQLERALPAALTPGLDMGAAYARREGNWYWTAGLFAADSANDGLRNKGQAIDGRLVWADAGEDHVRHIGAALSFRPQSSDSEIQFRSYPEVALSNVYLVNTGKFADVDHVTRAGIEYAEVAGAWSWQAESMTTWLSRINGLPELAFHGAYAELSWFPWEGRRRYDAEQARFGAIGDVGHATVQFSARISHIDLSSHDVDGGRETNLTLAANWYVTDRARLGANLVKVMQLEGGPFHGTAQGDYVFVVRLQYDFF